MRGLGLNLSQKRMGGSFGTNSLGSRFGNPMSNIPVLNKPVTNIPSTLNTSVTTNPLPGPSTGSPSSGTRGHVGAGILSKLTSILQGEYQSDLGKITVNPGPVNNRVGVGSGNVLNVNNARANPTGVLGNVLRQSSPIGTKVGSGGPTLAPNPTVAPTPPATTGPSTTTPPAPPPTAVPVSNPEAVSGPYTGGSLSI